MGISLGLGLGLTVMQGAGGSPAPVAFAYQAETETIADSFSTAPTTARKRTIDRCVRRLKAAGVWDKATMLLPAGLDEDASLTNWKDGSKATKVGSPTFSANDGWTGATTTGYINTGINANTLSQNDLGIYVWSQTTTVSSNTDAGCTNSSSQGVTVSVNRTDNSIGCRVASAFSALCDADDSDGYGMSGASRFDSTNMTGNRNGLQKLTAAQASVALPSLNIYYCTNNGNGTASTTPGRKLAFLYLGKGLTELQVREMTGAIGEYLDAIQYGEPYIEELGVGTTAITADCVAYGFTTASVLFCLQAARQGKSVALIGGWRDRFNFGGVVSGGLGYTDFNDLTALGGLPRYLIKRVNTLQSASDTSFKMIPKMLKRALQELLDSTKNGGFSIPIYITNGVSSVSKTGAVIDSFTTMDGRTVTASQFHDGSYEGDLLRLAGVSYSIGREAAGTGTEANNGVKLSTTNLDFDPWLTEGDTSSGLLPNIQGVRSTFSTDLNTLPDDGTADSGVQSYNFRMTATKNAARLVPFTTFAPPTGYDEDDYEFLKRFLDSDTTIDTFAELFKADLLYSGTYDVNNINFISSDFVGGGASDYPLASYAEREVIWKNHWNYLLGFLYTISNSSDTRVPSGLKSDVADYGFMTDHYWSPHENDSMFAMPQMYIRESIRMQGEDILNGNDLTATDGTAPRISDHTISCISYNTDSHAIRRVAYEGSAGVWSTRNEGGLGIATGGTDQRTPVPFEITVPSVSECSNLSVSFCVSTTHVGFGAYRMEPTMWQVGQSLGLAASLAIDGDGIIQNVDYESLRTALLASPSLTNEVIPVLPIIFMDDFDRDQTTPATALEDSPISSSGHVWTWDGNIAGGVKLEEQNAHCETSNSVGTAYFTTDLGSTDMYVQYAAPSTQNLTGPFNAVRLVDRNNFVGVRTGSESGIGTGVIEVYKRVSGTFTQLYVSAASAFTQLDTIRLEVEGDTWRLSKNGTQLSTGSIGTTFDSRKAGLVARTTSGGGFSDDFKAAAL
jgi:hypothetical protein